MDILTKYSTLATADHNAKSAFLTSTSCYADQFRATVQAFTLPSGRVDTHNMSVYLTAIGNKEYPSDLCVKPKDGDTPALKLAFDAWLAPYRVDRQDTEKQQGVFVLTRKSKDGKRSISVTFKTSNVIAAETAAAEAAEAAKAAEAEALAAEIAEIAEANKQAMEPCQIAEAMRKYVKDNWPDADYAAVLAEAIDAETEAETEAEAEAEAIPA